MPTDSPDVSYRALLRIPSLARVVASMQLARIAGAMTGVALVLFTLLEYDSPALAGAVTLASILPGLALSPIAGALLDRHGRVRLVQLDYVIAACALVLVGSLSLAGALPPPLLLLIAGMASLTNPLSQTGLRSLFPIMVPRRLWERVNAVDSNGYVVAIIIGPPLAAIILSIVGPALGLVLIAIPMAIAALVLIGVREPHTETATTGNLLLDAWQGLMYVLHNPTLRGLGVGMTLNNFANGAVSIIVPLLVLDAVGAGELAVGIAFAVSGLTGMVSAFWVGRMDTRGREWKMLWLAMLGAAIPIGLLLPGAAGWADGLLAGYGLVLLAQGLSGLFAGPLDISMFTMRQRRTDPAWLGRAFAVSMAINFSGFPIGAAVAGALASWSLPAAVGLAVVAGVLSSVASALLVPKTDRMDEPDRLRPAPAR
ncbi:MAG: MFS transporter [Chloroflexota bacterium]